MSVAAATVGRRVDAAFAAMRREKRCGLVAYVTCGDPDLPTTVRVIEALARAGADAIELGLPFSDPIADGPVIQAAALRALRSGTTIRDVLDVAVEVRKRTDVPLIAFSYLNPILRFGASRFAEEAREAGVDSLLLTDLPPESAGSVTASLRNEGLGCVFLIAPTSPGKRIRLIDRATDGFVYYVSRTGVTGAQQQLDSDLLARLDAVRALVKHPLAVGFGISRQEHYAALASHCDAVVVGSAIVRAVAEGDAAGAPARAAGLVQSILGANR